MPVAEVAAVAPEPVLTTPSVRSTRAPPRAWDIALDMPAGVSAPFGYFDPAGLGKKVTEKRAKYFRECELKHGRVAMLAAFGFPVAEHFHPLFGGNIDVPSYVAYQQTPLQTFWPVVLLYVAIVEIFSVFTFENPFGKGGFWTLKDDRVPGDFGWDPMDMYPWATMPATAIIATLPLLSSFVCISMRPAGSVGYMSMGSQPKSPGTRSSLSVQKPPFPNGFSNVNTEKISTMPT